MSAKEERQRESEAKYRGLFERMAEGFVVGRMIYDEHGKACDYKFVEVNPAFENLTGIPREEALRLTIKQLIPSLEPSWIERHAQVVETGQPLYWENFNSQTGKYYEIRSYSPRPGLFASIFTDITEPKRSTEALRASEERYRSVIETAYEGIWSIDAQGRTTYANQRMTDMLGYTREEMLGRVHTDFMWKEDRPKGDLDMESRVRGNSLVWDQRYRRKDGTELWTIASCNPLYDCHGSFIGALGMFTNITERKKAERALAESQAGLERLVAERTAKLRELIGELEHFSYSITHDMRAPLRAMRGFAEAMREVLGDATDPDAKVFLRHIITSAKRMDLLITDALNYSRTLRQELSLAPVDVDALLKGMLETYPEFLAHRQSIQIDGKLPIVIGNEAGLIQCFSNLVGNAVKFVESGKDPEVRIRAEIVPVVHGTKTGDAEAPSTLTSPGSTTDPSMLVDSNASNSQATGAASGDWVRIWVEDRGIGISDRMLPRVFNMFSRGTNEYEGTGIGLAMVRKVIQRMGGRTGVESELGKGSRFWIELPAPLEPGEVARRARR